METQHRSVYLAVVALAGIIVIGGILLYYHGKQNVMTNQFTQFNSQYKDAQSVNQSGNFTEAINAYNNLINKAPDKASMGKSKILLANNLYRRNDGNDRMQAIQKLEEVFNDYSIPPYVRALALNALAGIARMQDDSSYKLYFPDPPFNNYWPSSGSNLSKTSAVYLKILQLSDQTYPNSYAEYMIAGNYYTSLLVNNGLESTTTPKEAAIIMQKYIKEADTLSDESMYSPNVSLERYLYRATGLNASNRILNNISKEERERAFRLVLEKGAQYENADNYLARTVVMRGRFYLANFLMEFFPRERDAEIKDILKPFAEASNGSDASFGQTRIQFANLQNAPDSDYLKTRSVALAKISPEFKEFLISVGIKL